MWQCQAKGDIYLLLEQSDLFLERVILHLEDLTVGETVLKVRQRVRRLVGLLVQLDLKTKTTPCQVTFKTSNRYCFTWQNSENCSLLILSWLQSPSAQQWMLMVMEFSYARITRWISYSSNVLTNSE